MEVSHVLRPVEIKKFGVVFEVNGVLRMVMNDAIVYQDSNFDDITTRLPLDHELGFTIVQGKLKLYKTAVFGEQM